MKHTDTELEKPSSLISFHWVGRASIIRLFGYEISEAASGSEAIQNAARVKPGLILLDLNLPDMNGIDVALAIKKNPATNAIPIIACSAYPRAEEKKDELFRAGIVAYLQKPISAALLKAKLKEFILP